MDPVKNLRVILEYASAVFNDCLFGQVQYAFSNITDSVYTG
jgi:hypothetical protein